MGFSADWLALREPADHAARDRALLAAAGQAAGSRPVIVDLGCGTGSTIRAFAGALAGQAEWRLVDNDADLLERAAHATDGKVTTHRIDLRDLAALPLDGATLVTASALLDLCSRDWVEDLARRLARLGLPFYAALNYDGVMHWTPADHRDDAVTQAFNRHQRGDKGLGPALGPDAPAAIETIFTKAGYRVQQADSPWTIGPDQAALHHQLLQGIADAAAEAGATDAPAWGAARVAAVGGSMCHIGHRDILALPGGAR
jgi:SAM-dependent methyltransferase